MADRDHHFRLSDRRWLWRYSPLKGLADGWTMFADRKVLINSKLKGKVRLETECHEALHAILGPDIVSEECVTATAADLSRVLWALGYRLPTVGKSE
jgi:hypothetical protein